MRLSRDKVNKLAHTVTDAVADLDEVEFIEDRNTIRLEVRKILEELLMQEARIDQAARQKIESQRRTIIEGSEEWSILYRKYYNDEVKKLGCKRPVETRLAASPSASTGDGASPVSTLSHYWLLGTALIRSTSS